MFTFDSNHIFTGYLKQLLGTFPLPTCKVYTTEFIQHKDRTGKEDPRVLASTKLLGLDRPGMSINYVKDNSIYQYRWNSRRLTNISNSDFSWVKMMPGIYEDDKAVVNFTRTLKSSGSLYDTKTHEYLGEYLRFLRDYHGINLMSLYNCFSNQIYNNISFKIAAPTKLVQDPAFPDDPEKQVAITVGPEIVFNSYDPKYKIYALPVKLFEKYTIAIDSPHGYELCCGFYNTTFDNSARARDLVSRTYQRVRQSIFGAPIVYDKLAVEHWSFEAEFVPDADGILPILNKNIISRLDIAQQESDLKLFIKIPTSCASSITVLEGDYTGFNDCSYTPHVMQLSNGKRVLNWQYRQNHFIVNAKPEVRGKKVNINTTPFTPISKIQLLAFNTGISYPFADRLVEYLVGSAITPLDPISDNVRRAQKVMNDNGIYFEMDGIWEQKMQKFIYDQLMVAGPFEVSSHQVVEQPSTVSAEPIIQVPVTGTVDKLTDKRQGRLPSLGHTRKSTLYDVLGYIDRHAEKFYASWQLKKLNKNTTQPAGQTTTQYRVQPKDTIQDVDIYNGIYEIK